MYFLNYRLPSYFVTIFVSVCFKVFDSDHDGMLSRDDLISMLESMLAVRKENMSVDDQVITEIWLSFSVLVTYD